MDRFTCEVSVLARGVSKWFKSGEETTYALRNVYFDALVGELSMIVGRSGSGKTTLLAVLAGILKPDEGDIEIYGELITKMEDFELAAFRRQNIGFIFQNNYLVESFTNLENVAIPLLLNGVDTSEATKKSEVILEKMGMGHKKDHYPYELSGGQQQRVAIARALVHEPKLVICDEPTASLDAEMSFKVMDLIADVVRSPGRSVIIVTHDNRIFKYADRLFFMEDGRITKHEESEEESTR